MAAKPQTITAVDQPERPPTLVSNLNLHRNTGKQQSNKLGATAGNLILDFPYLKRDIEGNLCCRNWAEKKNELLLDEFVIFKRKINT